MRKTGEYLNEKWGIGARQARYSKAHNERDHRWYMHLTEFPGALCDDKGFVLFETEDEYMNCDGLTQREHCHAYDGISSLTGYREAAGTGTAFT